MLKNSSLFAVTSLSIASLFVSNLQADVAGIEIGAYQWTPDYTGFVAVDDGTQTGTELNLQDDLGFSDASHNVIWVSLEHPVPFLPNFKLLLSDLDVSASAVLTRDIDFAGQTFPINENVTTRIDLSNIEYTLYYEVLDNWLNLDVGITLRQYEGVITLNTDSTGSNINKSEALDFTIPLIYLKGRVDLPLTGFFVDGAINVIAFGDDSLSDIALSIGYESDFGLGGKAGYRTFSMNVDESNFASDLEFSGTYLSVFFHF